jgi:hypothetical protein
MLLSKKKIGFRFLAQPAKVLILSAIFVFSCPPVDMNKQDIPLEYKLDILYGSVEDYSGNDGQWLNLYQAESATPTPVYIWAHK